MREHVGVDRFKSEGDNDLDINLHSMTKGRSSFDKKKEEEYIAYFYDCSEKATFIESLFGEPYHIPDEYASHQITLSLILCLMCESIVTGSILWLQIAIRYYLIEEWSVGPSQFVGILSVVQIPFTIRIFYGLLIDSITFFGYKRKSYLYLFGIIAILSSFGLIYYHSSFIIQIICLCIRSFAIAFCDVIISAITVERSEFKSHSVAIRLQSLNYFSMYVVSGIGLIIAAKIEQSQKPKDIVYVYWIYFAVTFLIIVGAILLPEQKLKYIDAKSLQIVDNDIDNDDINKLYDDNTIKDNGKNNDKQQLLKMMEMMEMMEQIDDNRIKIINDDRPHYTVSQILQLTFETFCRKIS